MTIILILLGGGFLLLALYVLLLVARYNKFRHQMPQPPFKQAPLRPDPRQWRDDEVNVAWIGHSTLLFNLYGTKILTDPILGHQVGIGLGLTTIGPKRHTGPALTAAEIGPVDLILLSHAHMDHVDMPSLRQLAGPHTDIITAAGTSRLFKRLKFGHVHELGGTDAHVHRSGVTVTAVPVRHWGNRFPWNKDYGYTGYVLEKRDVRLFFAGDTAYTDTFRALQAIGPIDIAFLPIGAYSPDHFQRSHCTPEQAWQMFEDCGARLFAPIHWDTFVLSYEPVDEPLQRLIHAAGDQADRIIMREHGASFRITTR